MARFIKFLNLCKFCGFLQNI